MTTTLNNFKVLPDNPYLCVNTDNINEFAIHFSKNTFNGDEEEWKDYESTELPGALETVIRKALGITLSKADVKTLRPEDENGNIVYSVTFHS